MNTTLSSLTESVVENGKTILAATLPVQGEGERPHRVVLRYWRGEYVTHVELLKSTAVRFLDQPGADAYDAFEHDGYMDGHYFGQDLDKAMTDFQERAAKLLSTLTRKGE
jgi:hypothetical protein